MKMYSVESMALFLSIGTYFLYYYPPEMADETICIMKVTDSVTIELRMRFPLPVIDWRGCSFLLLRYHWEEEDRVGGVEMNLHTWD